MPPVSYPAAEIFLEKLSAPKNYFCPTAMLTATHTYTDDELLEGIRRRDNAALSAVYRLYRPRIVAFVVNHGGTEQEATDVLQEAIIAIFINAQNPDFQWTHSFNAYLYGICQRQWLKKLRDKNRRAGVSLDAPEVLQLSAAEPGDADRASRQAERQLLIIEKFKSLSEGCRELLQLAVIEEKPPEAIAAQLGFGSLNYFYKRKSKCKDKLADLVRSDPSFGELKN